jgi:predicted S18 family serine protease
MSRTKKDAKMYAKLFVEFFQDMYNEDEEIQSKVQNMTEEEALKFVKEHIEFIVGTNGPEYLFTVEKEACKNLGIKI